MSDGYATTPVVVNGVVYMQDLESNVMAIELATGKVLWKHDYNSINGGPDGVNVVNGWCTRRQTKPQSPCRRPPADSCGVGP